MLNDINFYDNTPIDGSYIMTMFMIIGYAYIDELAIWDRILSQDEVKILSNMKTQFYPDGPK